MRSIRHIANLEMRFRSKPALAQRRVGPQPAQLERVEVWNCGHCSYSSASVQALLPHGIQFRHLRTQAKVM